MSGSPRDCEGVLPDRPPSVRLDDGALRVAAPAKLNLDLLVGPRRDDGFHELDSLVAKVTLYDDLVLRSRADGRITLSCRGADCGPDEENLALRAARRLAAEAERTVGADVELIKSIPPGRGLGGGSSDAAAVLRGLRALWDLALPESRLSEIAAELGSDVPVFLGPAASRMTGRGERVAPADVPAFVAMVHLPEMACSTAEVYRRFDELGQGSAGAPRRRIDRRGGAWAEGLRNDLTAAALDACESLRRRVEQLGEAFGPGLHLTGSGSAVFVLCEDEGEAIERLRRLPDRLRRRTVLVRRNPW